MATEHSGHAAGSEVQFVDERVAGGGADVAAHSVPPRRPCSVGWRGATVLCTRALRDAEWARLTATYRDSNPNLNPNPSPNPNPNPNPYLPQPVAFIAGAADMVLRWFGGAEGCAQQLRRACEQPLEVRV